MEVKAIKTKTKRSRLKCYIFRGSSSLKRRLQLENKKKIHVKLMNPIGFKTVFSSIKV